MKEGLEQCVQSHELRIILGFVMDQLRFTRLIDVGVDSAGTVYSVKGSDVEQGTNYIGLSHRLGSGYTYNLQTNDKDALADGINIALLPGSFRNATVVVRDLGQRYLWIDSLCIVEDSLIDWKQESEKMAAIYSNALFTIAADRATSDIQGFLSRRGLTSERPRAWSPPHEMCPGMFTQNGGYPSHYSVHVASEEPLYRPAWVLQEQQLSRRIVSFASSMAGWNCHTLHATENGFSTTYVYNNLNVVVDLRLSDIDSRVGLPN